MRYVADPRLSHTALLLALGAAVAVGTGQFVSESQRLRQMRQRDISLRRQVGQTEQLLLSAGGQTAWTLKQLRRLRELRQRLPPSSRVPQLLDALLELVAGEDLELVNVNQGGLEPATDAEGKPIVFELDQATFLRLPVGLILSGRFRAVLAYLERLASPEFGCLVNVEAVHLVVNDPATARLKASVRLNLYVRSP